MRCEGPVGGWFPVVLYLCATPIGHLGDITVRALEVLRRADLILAEDTRTTRRLTEHYAIHARLESLHQYNEERRISPILERLRAGQEIVLVSDAGMPLVSDPGYRLVRAVIEAGLPMTVLPGPSAVLTALVVSGFSPIPFCFIGFLPRRAGERRQALALWRHFPGAIVAFEAPHRLAVTLRDVAEVMGPDRPVAIARELTKLHEEVWRGRVAEACERFPGPVRGEVVLVIGAAVTGPAAEVEVGPSEEPDDAVLAEEVAALSRSGCDRREALREVARRHGISRRKVYAACLRKRWEED
ncbi:MAG: 16S rRNA (cytidine(1402)-2'-O)-methyltransferase [Clostridia bacterium]|nr:16S rRNA (cytidine(1402)-2'-O)-methyltransferase [Clostridia bacterium]